LAAKLADMPADTGTQLARQSEGNNMRKFALLGVAFAASLTVGACSTTQASNPAAVPGTGQASQASSTAGSASAATAPAGTGTTAPAASSSAVPPASAKAQQDGFASAATAWKSAAGAPAATMNTFLQRAADDLKASGNPGYQTAIDELTYLAQLPATNVTSAQRANAQSDVKDLDNFFGTPGQLS
jgi:hypothetical protein